MNTEKFSPGSWQASNHDDNDQVVIRRSDDVIIANLECDGYNLSDDEINANANLIEAAPDMYEALKDVYSEMIGTCPDDDPLFVKMKLALAKANRLI